MNNRHNNRSGLPVTNSQSKPNGPPFVALSSSEYLPQSLQERSAPAVITSLQHHHQTLFEIPRYSNHYDPRYLQQVHQVHQHQEIQYQLRIQQQLLNRQLQLKYQRELIREQQLLRNNLNQLILPGPAANSNETIIDPSIPQKDQEMSNGNKRKEEAVREMSSTFEDEEPQPKRKRGRQDILDKPKHDYTVTAPAQGLIKDKDLHPPKGGGDLCAAENIPPAEDEPSVSNDENECINAILLLHKVGSNIV